LIKYLTISKFKLDNKRSISILKSLYITTGFDAKNQLPL